MGKYTLKIREQWLKNSPIMISNTKSVLSVLFSEKKYYLVFFIFIISFFFLKVLPTDSLSESGDLGGYLYSADHPLGYYNESTIKTPSELLKGNSYRITLSYIASSCALRDTLETEEKINVYLRNNTSVKRLIGTSVIASENLLPQEYILTADDNYEFIVFEKQQSSNNLIYIDNLQITHLETTATLQATNFYYPSTQYIPGLSLNPDTKLPLVKLNAKDKEVGQIFKAEELEMLTGASFQLNFHGKGGGYAYSLVVRPAEKTGDTYTVKEENVALYQFSSAFAQKYLKMPCKENQYWFPVRAKLEKNSYYFIGFVNTSKTTFSDYMELIGTTDNGGDYPAVLVNKERETKALGALQYNLWGIENLSSQIYPLGSLVQAINQVKSTLVYQEKFDPHNVNTIVANTNTSVTYKYRLNGFLANGNFILKFARPGEKPSATISVSGDGANWKIIKTIKASPNFQEVFLESGLPDQNDVYIKVTVEDGHSWGPMSNYVTLDSMRLNFRKK